MKKILTVVLLVAATIFTNNLFAQKQSAKKAEKEAKQEQLMQTRLEMLKNELQLSDTQAAAFEPIYRRYRTDITRVVDNRKELKAPITNENAMNIVAARLSNTINTTSVKQQFMHEFAKVIEPVQIEKLYRIEGKIARDAHRAIKAK